MPSQVFDDENYCKEFLHRLTGLRHERRYTDVTLSVDDVIFPCHKVVLSSACTYFYAMFTSGLDESTSDKVTIKGTDAETMRDIVEYMYTGRIMITGDSAQRLLQACDLFHLEGLKKACEKFMLNEIEPVNCIGLYKFAMLFGLKSLKEGARWMMMTRYKDVVGTSEFLDLSAEELVEYISDDDLEVENENIVYDSGVQWVGNGNCDRNKAFDAIIQYVRLPFCSSDYLCYIVNKDRLILESKASKGIVEEARAYHMLPDRRYEMVSTRTVPRASFLLNRRLVVLGGLTKGDHENRHCWYLNEEKSSWNLLAQLPRPNWKFYAACVLQSGILVCGGYHGSVKTECWLFDTVEKKWKSLPGMIDGRCKHKAVVHCDKVYVVGGEDDNDQPLDTVEKYDCQLRAWNKIASMKKALSDPLVHSCGAFLFVFGGIGSKDETSISTQMYDPVWNEWILKADMPEPCRLGAGAVINDRVYIVGGYSRACMSYTPATDSWTMLSRPREKHCNAPAVVWCARILLAGGDVDSHETTTIVEEYNNEQDKWSYWKLPLKEELSCHYMLNVHLHGI